ncbi:MAG: methylglyoxal synthase [Bacteroidales bacterium]
MKIHNIALVAHDNRKKDLIAWVKENQKTLEKHKLICTGTTGKKVREALEENLSKGLKLDITCLNSGPLGGDQEMGALIAKGKIDMFIFLIDPMQPQPHDVDVKALTRISVLYNIPTAFNRTTADFLISSPMYHQEFTPKKTDYSIYLNRNI